MMSRQQQAYSLQPSTLRLPVDSLLGTSPADFLSNPLPPTPSTLETEYSTPRRNKSAPPSAPHENQCLTVRIQLFPHVEHHVHHRGHHTRDDSHFMFTPVEMDLAVGSVMRIGRKVDRKREREARGGVAPELVASGAVTNSSPVAATGTAGSSNSQQQHHQGQLRNDTLREPDRHKTLSNRNHHVSGSSDDDDEVFGGMIGDAEDALPANASSSISNKRASMNDSFQIRDGRQVPLAKEKSSERAIEFVAFRSKVISRTHAELWIGADGEVYFRDVGSSSGSFLNRLRLSPSGKESRPYPLKSGDVIQLGVDYQGRQEEIYKSVMIKIFITVKSATRPRPNPVKLRSALRQLLAAMNGDQKDEYAATDCCICLCSISTCQALFLAPCSHCFHYKCVVPLLGSSLMFQCPLCRQVANLDASVNGDEQETTNEEEEEEELAMELGRKQNEGM
ncbi:hypothetical protein SeLEV6574_g00380 [Synchytrium endobioticum]|uniref:RING-type domain-containing protein n=1 Tax=Synchytrium endobioticum TaxID=286115 RepID=A0A507DJ19_9FUNG|nr:hypothetical protein SeLEV6574_g00380 [Synchytrium endobioticum]